MKTLEFEQFKSLEELKQYLCDNDHEDSIVFDNPSYLSAIIGVDNRGAVIYDYELMAESLVETDGISIEEAYDFLDFNMIRTLPYIQGIKPIVMYRVMV